MSPRSKEEIGPREGLCVCVCDPIVNRRLEVVGSSSADGGGRCHRAYCGGVGVGVPVPGPLWEVMFM